MGMACGCHFREEQTKCQSGAIAITLKANSEPCRLAPMPELSLAKARETARELAPAWRWVMTWPEKQEHAKPPMAKIGEERHHHHTGPSQ